MWTLKRLIDHCNQVRGEFNGKWVPARPINWKHRKLRERIKESMAVFSGKAEAFTWPEGQ